MKKKTHRRRRARRANPAANPHKRRVRRARRHNPRRHHVRRHRNPTDGKGGALLMGVLAGLGSELIDYGTDQIGSTPMVQGAVSGGVHAAATAGALFLDTRLASGLGACTVKTLSQRVRTGMALSAAKDATKAATKPAVLKVGDKDPTTGKTITAIDTSTTPPTYTLAGLGAVTVARGALPPAMRPRAVTSTVNAVSVNR